MDQFVVRVYGQPAPQGSKRYVGQSKAGKGIIVNASSKLTPWRNDVCVQAIAELDRLDRPAPFSCAVSVHMAFAFNRPKSIKRSKRPYMSIAPDLSKLVRSTEDALTDAGVWLDDSLVVALTATKDYVGEGQAQLDRPGCVIWVHPVVPWEMPPGRGSARLELEAG